MILEHLLPRARAWLLSKAKSLTDYFTGLENALLDARDYAGLVFLDLLPEYTRSLDFWDQQFNLRPDASLTESQRRVRLDAAWKRTGGQSPRYLQDTIQAAGFDVYIHEWWEPGSNPPVVRDPFEYTKSEFYAPQCGEPAAQCGEPDAQCTGEFTPQDLVIVVEAGNPPAEAGNPEAEAGNFDPGTQGIGYVLVNKIYQTTVLASGQFGDGFSQFGTGTQFGKIDGFFSSKKVYEIPTDQTKWPYFLYFGGPVFGAPAIIPENRREEFENLLLEICPAQQWLAIRAIYV